MESSIINMRTVRHMVRKGVIRFLTIGCVMFASQGPAYGEEKEDIAHRLQQLTEENAEGYLRPLMRAVGGSIHKGVFHGAPDSKWGIDIYLGMKAMTAFVPERDKVFNAYFDGVNSETATVVGGRGILVTGPNAETRLPDGFGWDIVPLLVPQLQIGNVYGTQFILRYLPSTQFDDNIGGIDLFGGGVQHSLNQYIPSLPLDISVQGSYHVMKIGDFLDVNGFAYSFMASKTFSIFTLYGSIGSGTSKFTIDYDYDPEYRLRSQSAFFDAARQRVKLEQKIDEPFRGTLGLSLRLIIFKLNADYTFGDYQIATLGIGIAI